MDNNGYGFEGNYVVSEAMKFGVTYFQTNSFPDDFFCKCRTS